MPINKNAYRRYKVIDACLRNKMRMFPNMEELIDAIQEKLDVSTTTDTVQKDIANMKLPPPDGFDAPIKYNRIKKGYEYTDPNFAISGVSLNSLDVNAIKEAIDVIRAIGGSRVSEKFSHAIEKVLSSVQEDLTATEKERKIIQSDSVAEGRGFEHFDTFFAACRERIPISFLHYSYVNRTFKASIIHPILLKEFENRWYVIGYSESHNDLRTFGFDRIYHPIALRKPFVDIPIAKKEAYLNDVYGVYPLREGGKEEIVIKTNPMITNFFRTHKIHHSQNIVVKENGDALVSFELIPSMELTRLLLSYGNQIRVVTPKRLIKFMEQYK